jgi:hypothetical protein
MGNIVKFSTPVSVNSIKSGGFNIGVNATPADLTEFYTGICPINGGYTIYINKSSNGPSIYAPQNDTDLVNITKILGGNVSTVAEALVWINSQSNMTVANTNYPSIVTSGLTINLDAGFVPSYPKGGTGWNDLSGNNINSTLVNGPTFDSSNYGSIVFDGVDDVCTLPINTFTSGSPQNGTFIIKLKTPPFNNTTQLIFFRDGGTTNNLIYFYRNAVWATDTYAWLIYSNAGANIMYDVYLPNQWYETALTFDSQGNVKTYIDGVLRDSEVWDVGATSWNRSGSITPNLRCSSAGGPGNIQRFMYYNRALSATEILQNYYAGLQRFIPTNGLVLSLDAQNTNLYATSPTTAYDISGNANNGVLLNGTQYVGSADGSWRFDGVNDYINCGNSSTFNTNQFSAGFWVNLSISAVKEIFMKNNNSNNGIGPFEIWQSGRRIQHRINGILVSGTTDLILGKWYLITLTYNQVNKILYINETQENSNAYSIPLDVSTGNVTIGAYGNGDYPFNGNISEVFFYNRSLSQTEISIIYNATRARYGL